MTKILNIPKVLFRVSSKNNASVYREAILLNYIIYSRSFQDTRFKDKGRVVWYSQLRNREKPWANQFLNFLRALTRYEYIARWL